MVNETAIKESSFQEIIRKQGEMLEKQQKAIDSILSHLEGAKGGFSQQGAGLNVVRDCAGLVAQMITSNMTVQRMFELKSRETKQACNCEPSVRPTDS